jgi:hypothetical protein
VGDEVAGKEVARSKLALRVSVPLVSAGPASIDADRGEWNPPATPTNIAAQPPNINENPSIDFAKILIMLDVFTSPVFPPMHPQCSRTKK